MTELNLHSFHQKHGATFLEVGGMEVVAEGVETVKAWGLLNRLGCDEGQGWLFARPLQDEALLAWLAQGAAGAPGSAVRG